MKLTTRRLILSPLALADARPLFEVGSREDVSRPAGFPRTLTMAASRARVRRTIAACRKGSPRPLSLRVLRKAGLRREGTLRGYLKRSGEVRDEFIWGMTRADRRVAR